MDTHYGRETAGAYSVKDTGSPIAALENSRLGFGQLSPAIRSSIDRTRSLTPRPHNQAEAAARLLPSINPEVGSGTLTPPPGSPPPGAVVAGRVTDGRVVNGPVVNGRVVDGPSVSGGVVPGRVVDGPVVDGPVVDGAVVPGCDGAVVACGAVVPGAPVVPPGGGPLGGWVEAWANDWVGRPASHATAVESTARSTAPPMLRRVRDTIRACSNMLGFPLLLDHMRLMLIRYDLWRNRNP